MIDEMTPFMSLFFDYVHKSRMPGSYICSNTQIFIFDVFTFYNFLHFVALVSFLFHNSNTIFFSVFCFF